jgi:hypothetical protein
MEVNKMEKKSEKEERKKVTRRQFLKDLGLFAVAGIALNKLDFLAGEIIKRTSGGGILPEDWNCPSFYGAPDGCISPPYDCPSSYYCPANVECSLNFQCYPGTKDNSYGCTKRKFTCVEAFTCNTFNCEPSTFECSGGTGPGWFQCPNKYNPNY